ncbi:MAG: ATP synthase F1 subunit delta [bacterium]
MSVSVLAQRYARAFCELTHDEGNLDEAVDGLESLKEAFEPALDVIFSNPDISLEERHDLIDRAFSSQQDQSDPTFELIRRFCKLLVDKNRFRYFDEIVEGCREEADRILGRKRATVETPYELDENRRSRLKSKLAGQFDADVLLQQDISPELLAGLRIQVDDYLMDYSIQNQLEELYGQFRRST